MSCLERKDQNVLHRKHRTPVMVNIRTCIEQSVTPTCEPLIGKRALLGQNSVRATGDYVTCRLYLADIALWASFECRPPDLLLEDDVLLPITDKKAGDINVPQRVLLFSHSQLLLWLT